MKYFQNVMEKWKVMLVLIIITTQTSHFCTVQLLWRHDVSARVSYNPCRTWRTYPCQFSLGSCQRPTWAPIWPSLCPYRPWEAQRWPRYVPKWPADDPKLWWKGWSLLRDREGGVKDLIQTWAGFDIEHSTQQQVDDTRWTDCFSLSNHKISCWWEDEKVGAERETYLFLHLNCGFRPALLININLTSAVHLIFFLLLSLSSLHCPSAPSNG